MSFSNALVALRDRMDALDLVFPTNRTLVRNASVPGISGLHGTATRGVLGTSQPRAVIIKNFKTRDAYEHEFLNHVEVFIRLYGNKGQHLPVYPIISTPIYLGDGNTPTAAQTLLPGARDLIAYFDENTHSDEERDNLGRLLYDALIQLHAHGIAHGDIKADNIVVYEGEEQGNKKQNNTSRSSISG